MAPRFDLILVVDWSARAAPSPRRESADAVWIGADGADGPEPPLYLRTRAAALDHLARRLGAEAAAGRRVLVGFDFPFGWPRGAAVRVAGRPEGLALWAALERLVADGPDNRSDRFAVAARLNALWSGEGPFWGRPRSVTAPGVPARKGDWRVPGGPPADWPPERRHAEARERGAKSCWQLAYAGSVGSQALLGMPGLARLRRAAGPAGRVAVWPFETGWTPGGAPVTLAEIYPSMLRAAVTARRGPDEILDRAQVRVLAAAFAALDRAEGLDAAFAGPTDLDPEARETARREEAWILGLERREALSAALG